MQKCFSSLSLGDEHSLCPQGQNGFHCALYMLGAPETSQHSEKSRRCLSFERLPSSKEPGNYIAADLSIQTLLQPVQRYDCYTEPCNSPSRPSSPSLFPNSYRSPNQKGDGFLPGLAAGFSDFFSVNGKTEENISNATWSNMNFLPLWVPLGQEQRNLRFFGNTRATYTIKRVEHLSPPGETEDCLA